MKFVYQYRTRDNAVHSGEIVAADRDAAFRELKAKGVKPSRLTEASGFFNKLLGKGKRWIAIGVLSLSVLFLAALLLTRFTRQEPLSVDSHSPMPRQQVYGDPAILSGFERDGFASVFDHPGERLLAIYSRPGRIVDSPNDVSARDLGEALGHKIEFNSEDGEEVVKFKRIVLAMKDELRQYLADGGTSEGYLRRLVKRQGYEFDVRDEVFRSLKGVADISVWEEKNAYLRNLGIETIEPPQD